MGAHNGTAHVPPALLSLSVITKAIGVVLPGPTAGSAVWLVLKVTDCWPRCLFDAASARPSRVLVAGPATCPELPCLPLSHLAAWHR
jgi:hypothetical protein